MQPRPPTSHAHSAATPPCVLAACTHQLHTVTIRAQPCALMLPQLACLHATAMLLACTQKRTPGKSALGTTGVFLHALGRPQIHGMPWQCKCAIGYLEPSEKHSAKSVATRAGASATALFPSDTCPWRAQQPHELAPQASKRTQLNCPSPTCLVDSSPVGVLF